MTSKVLAVLLCLALASATLTVPLKSHSVYHKENEVDVLVDTFLYVDATVSHLGSTTRVQDEKLLIDAASAVNYVISSETKFGETAVSASAFNCNGLCEAGTAPTEAVSALGGKATLNGGVTLKASSEVNVDGNTVTENIYVPATVDAPTLETNLEILKYANGALSLGRTSESLVSKLAHSNKQVQHEQFSLYLHDQISQLNIGGIEQYFKQGNTTTASLATVSKADWIVTVTEILAREGTVLVEGAPINAHFDTTSKYIHVPHVDADPNTNSTAHLYFMTVKELPCFEPNNNLAQKGSFICNDIQSYDRFPQISLLFKTTDGSNFKVVLEPTDYIEKLPNGTYELLFRFTSAPQVINELYLGTAFLKKFYSTFNTGKGTVTLHNRYQVNTPASGTHISESYQIPFIVVGAVLALASVIALLAILKKVKVDNDVQPNVELTQQQYQFNNSRGPASFSQTAYSPVVNTSYNPVVVGAPVYNPQPVVSSVYNPALSSNTLVTANVSSSQLRQSQNIIRHSQQVVRNSQNYVITQNF